MAVVISMLRGVNVGAHHRIKMADLRAVYESLGHSDVQTHLQSGNVISRHPSPSAAQLEEAVEQRFGFRPAVILRKTEELRAAIAGNPFVGVEPSRLLVCFLADDPGEEARQKVRAMRAAPEEIWAEGRELYIYFPNGMARPKLSMASVEKALKVVGTGRNWNTVTSLLNLAEALTER
jgi:uncharacterized protein (DUF1697 family)